MPPKMYKMVCKECLKVCYSRHKDARFCSRLCMNRVSKRKKVNSIENPLLAENPDILKWHTQLFEEQPCTIL